MFSIRTASATSAVFALALAGCGTLPADEDTVSLPITNGQPTDGDPAVVGLLDDAGQLFCTGSAVSAELVLTAAHCLVAPAPPLSSLRLSSVAVGGAPGEPDVEVAAAVRRIDPTYDAATRRGDLALVAIAGAPFVAAPLPIAALPVPPSSTGAAVRAVGFGRDGTSSGAQRKRTGWARIESASGDFIRVTPEPSQPCQGDSGGPILLAVDGVEHIVGVVSHGDWLCVAYSDAARVDDVAAPFIHAQEIGAGCSVSGPAGAPAGALLVVLLLSLRIDKRQPKRTRRSP